MDFIEAWFHVSPDGGSGALEVLYVAAAVLVPAILVVRRAAARRAARTRVSADRRA